MTLNELLDYLENNPNAKIYTWVSITGDYGSAVAIDRQGYISDLRGLIEYGLGDKPANVHIGHDGDLSVEGKQQWLS